MNEFHVPGFTFHVLGDRVATPLRGVHLPRAPERGSESRGYNRRERGSESRCYNRSSILRTVVLLAFTLSTILVRAAAPSLDACISSALESNPNLQSATFRVTAAREAAKGARAAYYPTVSTVGAWTRTDNAPQAFMMLLNQRALDMGMDFNNPDATDNLRLSVVGRYRLFDGGKRSLSVHAAEDGAGAAAAQLSAVRNELVHEVTRSFYTVLQGRALVDVAKDAEASLEESLRVARARFDAGSAVRTDTLNLEVQLAEARERLISARNGLELAVAALNTSVGAPVAVVSDFDIAPEVGAVPALPDSVDARAPAARPELVAARLSARRAQRAWQGSKRAYVPDIDAFGSSDWDSDVSTDFERSYFVGVTASWKVFDGFARPRANAAARAEWLARKADEERVASRLTLDMTRAGLAVRAAHERLAVGQAGVESAEESLRITRQRYEQGAAAITDLLTAENGLSRARSRSVAVHYDYLIALSDLRRAEGRGAEETSNTQH